MCYWSSNKADKVHTIKLTSDKPIVAYKCLTLDLSRSEPFRSPSYSSVWTNFVLSGRNFDSSGSGGGIYCFKNEADARGYDGNCVVKVELRGKVAEFTSREATGGRCPGYKATHATIVELVSVDGKHVLNKYDEYDPYDDFYNGNFEPPTEAEDFVSPLERLIKNITVSVTVPKSPNEYNRLEIYNKAMNSIVKQALSYYKDELKAGLPLSVVIGLFLENEFDFFRSYIYTKKDMLNSFNIILKRAQKMQREQAKKAAERKAAREAAKNGS